MAAACDELPTTHQLAHRHFPESAAGIDVDPAHLDWPRPGEPAQDDYCGNQSYRDLRGLGWQRFKTALACERAAIVEYEAMAPDERQCAEEFWSGDDHGIQDRMGLEVGVASLVIAISAAGGVPFHSCNGGAFLSKGHLEPVPVVAFFWPLVNLGLLKECVVNTGTQLWSNKRGQLIVSADYIPRMINLAEEIYQRRALLAPAPPLRGNPISRKRLSRAEEEYRSPRLL